MKELKLKIIELLERMAFYEAKVYFEGGEDEIRPKFPERLKAIELLLSLVRQEDEQEICVSFKEEG